MLSKQQLICEIEDAFAGVQLGGGLSLNQTKAVDNYRRGYSTEEFTRLPQHEVTDDWTQIPFEALDSADALAHLDRRGFRYYIPALMLRLLDNYDPTSMMSIGTLSILYPKTESWEYLYSRLTKAQMRAIAHFLQSLPALVELDTEDTKRVKRALRNYWAPYSE